MELGESHTEAAPWARDPASPLRAGERLAGYVVEGVVGTGGMGMVYRARDAELDRRVALKVIAPGRALDAEFRRRFEREWRLAAAIEHPNVLPVYRAGEEGGRLFLAMRFVEGESLEERLKRCRLAVHEAVGVIEEIAQALDAAHSRGLTHRDVKPANILIDRRTGRAYLADFGLAMPVDAESRITRVGQFVGTVAYAAPEQIQGARADARTDVYALGGVLYHCLTGELPFPSEHGLEAVAAHLSQPPPRPSRLCGDLPAAFDRVVERAMAKDPDERFGSAGDLARAAVAAAEGVPSGAVARSPRSMPQGTRAHRGPLPRPGDEEPDAPSAALSGLVGRQAELDAIGALLCDPGIRLVTLTATGGMGKTRLALALAERLKTAFADGVTVVPLAAVREPDLVVQAIARELGLPEPAGVDPVASFAAAVADSERLIVLDNFEQLLPAAQLVAALVAATPALTFLVTSRAPLRIAGEHLVEVRPLSVPDPGWPADADALVATSDAAHLFLSRAREAQPDLPLRPPELEAAAAICRRLDGMPLALELAAARARHLPLEDLARRLDDRLALLRRGRADMPTRHQTLEATIDATYQVLPLEPQRLFARLAVFAGPFDLDAAEAICGEDLDVLESLSALIDNSLVRVDSGDGRYRVLQVIREFALKRLAGTPDLARVRERQLDYYVGLVERVAPALEGGPNAATAAEHLTAEHDNLRAALDWAEQQRDGERLLRIAARLRLFWWYRGFRREGLRRVEAGLGLAPTVDARLRAESLTAAGGLRLGRPDQEREAKAKLLEALAYCREHSIRDVEFGVLTGLALLDEGDDGATAERWELQALDVARELDDANRIGKALTNLSDIALERHDYAAALRYAHEALDFLNRCGDVANVHLAELNLGEVLLLQGDHSAAAAPAGRGLRLSVSMGDLVTMALALVVIGALAAARGLDECAVRLLAAAEKLRLDCGTEFQPVERSLFGRARDELKAKLGDASFDRAWNHGRAGSIEDAVALALEVVESDT